MTSVDLITSFLPKYPNIHFLNDELFDPYDNNNFNKLLYTKKEFYDNKLDSNEILPTRVGQLMKHQSLIARFLSSNTLYYALLLVHEMGTGKTCSAIGAIEQIKSEGLYKGALYIAKGESLLDNFINELIFKCTDGRYIPEDGDIQEFERLTDLEKTHRKKKAIKDFYKLNTFETFAKEISRSSSDVLKRKYNNRIIVIDEIHNLRMKSADKGLNVYEQFHTLLHTVENCKIILLSGTPMKDGISEIASVMNLILPIETQLPTGDQFVNTYFDEYNGIYSIKQELKQELKNIFKGRVSYVKTSQTDVKKQFVGVQVGDLNYLHVVRDEMHDFQEKGYTDAYELDTGERRGVFSNSRQASLFVFPDKTWGKEGFDKYVIKSSNPGFTSSFVLKQELINDLRGETHEDTLKSIYKYSSKYAAVIENILNAKKEGKLVFIYNEYVQGSGLILFSLLLNLFGYSKANGNESGKTSRYAILTNMTATSNQINKLVKRFNQPDNMNGDIIHVIMGSRKISEGFSFKNIQVEEIHTPWFNYSETSQAIARGSRFGSHEGLLKRGFKPELKIYQRVSMPKRGKSIDLKMYEQSEIKDISIKGVERLLKESAWDCSLTYNRNHITGSDNERDCDYMSCEYTCDGVDKQIIEKGVEYNELDYSTYQLYYQYETIQAIIRKISLVFRNVFSASLDYLVRSLNTYKPFEIVSALYTIINENVQITNKYGFRSYLKEYNNVLYLIENLSVKDTFLSGYYTEYPHIQDKDSKSFDKVTSLLYKQNIKNVIRKISTATNMDVLRLNINTLPIELQEFFLESALTARSKNIQKHIQSRDLILDYFRHNYKQVDGIYISWLLYTHNRVIRCMKDDDTWFDCSSVYDKMVQDIVSQVNIDSTYGFYGQTNRDDTAFCIRDLTVGITDKKHTRTSGRVCKTWKKDKLYDMLLVKLVMPIPDEQRLYETDKKELAKIREMDTQTIKDMIQTNKYMKDLDVTNIDRKEAMRVLFWIKLRISSLCSHIKQWFDDNNLLIEDNGCGDTRKLKL